MKGWGRGGGQRLFALQEDYKQSNSTIIMFKDVIYSLSMKTLFKNRTKEVE